MAPDPLDVLRTVPLFRQVPEEDLRALAGLVRERRQPKGSLILTQGDEGEALYLIRSGQVKVSVVAEDGREVILSVLGASDPLLEVNDWIGDHRLQLTLVTFAIVAIGVWRTMRKGLHPIETPAELAEELRTTESGDRDETA